MRRSLRKNRGRVYREPYRDYEPPLRKAYPDNTALPIRAHGEKKYLLMGFRLA